MSVTLKPGEDLEVLATPGQTLKVGLNRRTATTRVRVTSTGTLPTTTPTTEPAPVPVPEPPAAGQVVREVSTIPELKKYLADDSVDLIVEKDGAWPISTATALLADSLYIGGTRGGFDLSRRTRPVTVRPETPRGMYFDGRGSARVGVAFRENASLLRWEDLIFDRVNPVGDGVVKFGGDAGYVPAHDLVLPGLTVLAGCKGRSDSSDLDHAVYVAHAKGRGPYNISIPGAQIDCAGGLDCGLHVYHSAAGAPNADHVSITGSIRNARRAIMVWDPTVHDFDVAMTVDSSAICDLDYQPTFLNSAEQAPGTPANMRFAITPTGTHPLGWTSKIVRASTGLAA